MHCAAEGACIGLVGGHEACSPGRRQAADYILESAAPGSALLNTALAGSRAPVCAYTMPKACLYCRPDN